MAQKEFYNLRIENSMINFLIAEKETPVHANGVGIEDGDHVFFIDAEGSCSVETELIYPVQNGVAMVTLPAGTESPSARATASASRRRCCTSRRSWCTRCART